MTECVPLKNSKYLIERVEEKKRVLIERIIKKSMKLFKKSPRNTYLEPPKKKVKVMTKFKLIDPYVFAELIFGHLSIDKFFEMRLLCKSICSIFVIPGFYNAYMKSNFGSKTVDLFKKLLEKDKSGHRDSQQLTDRELLKRIIENNNYVIMRLTHRVKVLDCASLNACLKFNTITGRNRLREWLLDDMLMYSKDQFYSFLMGSKLIVLFVIIDHIKSMRQRSNTIDLDLDYNRSKPTEMCIKLDDCSYSLQKDIEVVIAFTMIDPGSFKCVNMKMHGFNDSKKLALIALNHKGEMLFHASDRLRNNKEVVKVAALSNVKSLLYASRDLKDDKKFLLELIEQRAGAFVYASISLKTDINFILTSLKLNSRVFKYAVDIIIPLGLVLDVIKINRDFITMFNSNELSKLTLAPELIELNGNYLRYLNKETRNNENIVLMAINNNGRSVRYASDSLRAKKSIMSLAISKDPSSLEFGSYKLRDDSKFVMIAISKDPDCFRYVSENLLDNEELFLKALSSDIDVFRYASTRLKSKKSVMDKLILYSREMGDLIDLSHNVIIMTHAVNCNPENLEFVSEDLENYEDLVLTAIENDGRTIEFASDKFKGDIDIVKNAVGNYGKALEFASDGLKIDKDVVKIAIENDGNALEFAAYWLKNNKKIVKLAVTSCGKALEFASDELKGDREIVKIAVMNDGEALQFASFKLKDDIEIVVVAIHNSPMCMKYASTRVRMILRKLVLKY